MTGDNIRRSSRERQGRGIRRDQVRGYHNNNQHTRISGCCHNNIAKTQLVSI